MEKEGIYILLGIVALAVVLSSIDETSTSTTGMHARESLTSSSSRNDDVNSDVFDRSIKRRIINSFHYLPLGKKMQVYPLRGSLTATPTSPPGTQEATACEYPIDIVSIALFDSSIPGDVDRMTAIAVANRNAASSWYDNSLVTFYQRLSDAQYSPILSSQNSQFHYALWDINTMAPYIDEALDPIYDSNNRIIGTTLNLNAVENLVLAPDIFHGPPINHDDDKELILIVDKLVDDQINICGSALIQEGIISVGSQRPGVSTELCIVQQNPHIILAHEMGHSLGLDHYEFLPSNNIMFTRGAFPRLPDPMPEGLQRNQLMAMMAHLCGEPADKLTFVGRSGRFGVNDRANELDSVCRNGKIGKDEWCELGLLDVSPPISEETQCVNAYSDPLPVWPDIGTVCTSNCYCVDVNSAPYLPTPGPPRPPPTDGGGGDTTSTGGRERGGGPHTGYCGNGFLDPEEECDPPSGSCPEGTACNTNTCKCESTAVCGNDVVENGEQCDPPGSICNVVYNGQMMYCGADCACPIPPWPPEQY